MVIFVLILICMKYCSDHGCVRGVADCMMINFAIYCSE